MEGITMWLRREISCLHVIKVVTVAFIASNKGKAKVTCSQLKVCI